jgi:hypothetical protein
MCYTRRNDELFNEYQSYFVNFIVKFEILGKLIFYGIDDN